MGGLIFVGLGLAGLRDVSLRGLEAIRGAETVMAEFYTSRLIGADIRQIEALAGQRVRVLSRKDVEVHADQILQEAAVHRVAFLVAGDAMSATTHHDLRLRAQELGIPVRTVAGVSIFTAAPGACGLQQYKFGRATTLPFPEGKYQPESPYEVIRDNRARGLHTLVLLDIQAEEERYMEAPYAVSVLRDIEARRGEGVITPDTTIVGLARVGALDQRVVAAPAREWDHVDMGPPLHCLIVPGDLHFMEQAALDQHRGLPQLTRSA